MQSTFPSPLGDYGIWTKSKNEHTAIQTGFRPLSGSKASELVGFNTMTSGITCFRPLAGIMVSEPEQATAIASVRECFRPLSGIKVSELKPGLLDKIKTGLPSPLGE